jgi:predicted transcriptional regulator of viral defense system
MKELESYRSPKTRLGRLVKAGKIVPIRRGLYTDDANVTPFAAAPLVYGPSYISFYTALAYYDLIPERVYLCMSASFRKNKKKFYETPLGNFQYLYIPERVFPYGISVLEENGSRYLMASPEKALCDLIYRIKDIVTVQEMDTLLTEDLRMESDELLELDGAFIRRIAPLYRRRSLAMLAAWYKEAKR